MVCRFIHSFAEVPSSSARSSAASAVTLRFPLISSLSQARVQPILRENSVWEIPAGSRNSSKRISPGWKGFFGCFMFVLLIVFDSVVVDNLHSALISTLPSKHTSPLIIDSDRVVPGQFAHEHLQAISRLHTEVRLFSASVRTNEQRRRSPG